MFNPFQGMGNPMQMMAQQFTQGMAQNMMNQWKQQNPKLFNSVMGMIQGKSEADLQAMAQNVAKDKGINLDQFAKQFKK